MYVKAVRTCTNLTFMWDSKMWQSYMTKIFHAECFDMYVFKCYNTYNLGKTAKECVALVKCRECCESLSVKVATLLFYSSYFEFTEDEKYTR